MADAARTVIVVPARGGSKRLPRKNVLPLGGKPLILHAIDVALATGARVLVSTDDPEIKSIARTRSNVQVDDRRVELATDTIKVVDVIRELVDRPEIQAEFDVIGMLLPTCPFRTPAQVRAGIDGLDKDVDATIAFTTYEFPPTMAVSFDGQGLMTPIFNPSPLITGNTRSQDQVPTFRPNGAFFFSWIDAFRKLRSFYAGRVRGVTMPRINSVDIDDADDFAYAQYLIDRGQIAVSP
jgi:CMP-N,N'-diacetyllegionaminic acid synthase